MKAVMPVPLLMRLAGLATGPSLTHEAFLAAVAADISGLLNTRAPHHKGARRTALTTLDYGLPDWSAAATDGHEVAAHVEQALQAFEPRLKGVRVTPEFGGERLLLHVQASLAGEPATFLLQCDGGLFNVSSNREG